MLSRKSITKTISRFKKPAKRINNWLKQFPYIGPICDSALDIYRRFSTVIDPAAIYYTENFEKIPIEKNLILLESFWGRKIACNPYAFYQAIRGDKRFSDFRFIWVRNENISIPDDVVADEKVSLVEYQSHDYSHALLQAEHLISNSTFPPYFVRKHKQTYINFWHGIPIKHMGSDSHTKLVEISNTQRNFIQATGILLAGDYAEKKIVYPYQASILTAPKVEHIGSPRLDLTLNADPVAIRNTLGITTDKKVVLYAPTWRGTVSNITSESSNQLATVKALKTNLSDDYHIMVSLHNYTRKQTSNLPSGCAHIPDNIDINEILTAVDILVTDYSSIMVDFLLLDKPIVLYVPDRKEYEAERGMYINLDDFPAVQATTLGEVIAAVQTGTKPSYFDNYTETLNWLLPFEDGKASHRAADWLLNKKKENKTTLSKTKTRLLIHPGGLKPNGITSSFLNLIMSLDFDYFDVFILIDTRIIDIDDNRRKLFNNIDKRCHFILRRPRFLLSHQEKSAYKAFKQLTNHDELSVQQEQSLHCGFSRETRRIFGDTHFDTVIDFSGYVPFWSLIIANTNASRKVIYQHNDLYKEATNSDKNHGKHLFIVFKCYKYFDQIISVSPEIMEQNYKNLGHYYPAKVTGSNVPNALSPADIQKKSAAPLQHISTHAINIIKRSDTVKFITIGRMSPEKNQHLLLHAFSKVLAKGTKAHLFLVGTGSLKKSLINETKRLKIFDAVTFTGQLDNPFPLLSACDCFVLSSLYEGQGLVLLEAMVLGIPCISTNIQGPQSVLANGHGLLVENNEQGLANGMEKFIKDEIPQKNFNYKQYTNDAMTSFYKAMK